MSEPEIGTRRWYQVTPFHGARGTADTILRLLEQEEISRAKARELIAFAAAVGPAAEDGIAVPNELPPAPWDRLNWCDDIWPGDPIVKCSCPCCGAALDVTHGDDDGEIAVVGTPMVEHAGGPMECEEFEPSGLEVAADPDGPRDCEGSGWYRCRECARHTEETP